MTGKLDLRLVGAVVVLVLIGAVLLVLPSAKKDAADGASASAAKEAGGSLLALAESTLGSREPFSVADTEIIVYQPSAGSLAHIREKRGFELSAGRNSVEIADISSGMEPSSLVVSDLTDPSAILLEQTYTPALSAQDILRGYKGEMIIVRQGNSTVRGKLVSYSPLTLETDEGMRIFASYDSLSLAKVTGKPVKPTISLLVDAGKGGRHELGLSYLSSGISWSSDYALTIDEETSDLYALATIGNNAGAAYRNAKVTLVAGDIARESYYYGRYVAKEMVAGAAAPAEEIAPSELFEFKAYELPRKVDLADAESKQIPFLSRNGVKSRKTYVYEGGKAVRTELLIKNEKADGLGTALPAGKVRMFVKSGGSPVYVGEGRIANTAEGSNITLSAGNAFDLSGETKRTDYISAKCSDTYSYAIALRNSKSISVTIEVRQSFGGDYEIIGENFSHEKREQGLVVWKIPVKAGSGETLTYTVRYDYPYRRECGLG